MNATRAKSAADSSTVAKAVQNVARSAQATRPEPNRPTFVGPAGLDAITTPEAARGAIRLLELNHLVLGAAPSAPEASEMLANLLTVGVTDEQREATLQGIRADIGELTRRFPAARPQARRQPTHLTDGVAPPRDPTEEFLPLFDRLEYSVRYTNDDTRRLQPRIGGHVVIKRFGRSHTVWLPAEVWHGIASIIRQTPDHHRANVVAFLDAIGSYLGPNAQPMQALLAAVSTEVQDDPYMAIPEHDRDEFDLIWA